MISKVTAGGSQKESQQYSQKQVQDNLQKELEDFRKEFWKTTKNPEEISKAITKGIQQKLLKNTRSKYQKELLHAYVEDCLQEYERVVIKLYGFVRAYAL